MRAVSRQWGVIVSLSIARDVVGQIKTSASISVVLRGNDAHDEEDSYRLTTSFNLRPEMWWSSLLDSSF
jgi:hypothetical protein